jgi:hypothetical protein
MARTDPFWDRTEYFLSCPDESGALTALPVLLLSAAAVLGSLLVARLGARRELSVARTEIIPDVY